MGACGMTPVPTTAARGLPRRRRRPVRAGGGRCELAGRRSRAAMAGPGRWLLLAHGREWWPAGSCIPLRRLFTSGAQWRGARGSGVCRWCRGGAMGCAGSLLVEVLWMWRGAGYVR
jgi:hypothetical protein